MASSAGSSTTHQSLPSNHPGRNEQRQFRTMRTANQLVGIILQTVQVHPGGGKRGRRNVLSPGEGISISMFVVEIQERIPLIVQKTKSNVDEGGRPMFLKVATVENTQGAGVRFIFCIEWSASHQSQLLSDATI